MRVSLRASDSVWKCWFGITFLRDRSHWKIRVTDSEVTIPECMPERVKRIYGAFGGLYTEQGRLGFLPPDEIFILDNWGGAKLGNQEMRRCMWVFYTYGTGDFVCCNRLGNALLLNHEEESLEELDMDEFLDEALRDRRRAPRSRSGGAPTSVD